MLRTCSIALLIMWLICGCQTYRQRVFASAPRTCQEIRGAYCIENVGLTVEKSTKYNQTELVVYEDQWKQNPLVILEESSCKKSKSNMVKIINYNKKVVPNELTVRLVKNGGCDLVLRAGSPQDSGLGWALSTALTEIRACQRRPCEGPVIGGIIRQSIDK